MNERIGEAMNVISISTGRQYVKPGSVPASVADLAAAIRDEEVCGARVWFDSFTQQTFIHDLHSGSEARPYLDEDNTRLRERLQLGAGFKNIGRDAMRDVIDMIALERVQDSAIDWLSGLTWDGVCRVESFVARYMGGEDSAYTRAVSRYIWTALAGRVLVPGSKADMVPVAVGKQGARKSSAIEAMAPDPKQFGILDLATRDADTARLMQGKLVLELAELRGLRTREADAIKAFITASHDDWTPKYKERSKKASRRCVFFGSTNEPEFQTDPTGGRRWLPFHVQLCDPELVKRDREQLWAEGAKLFIEAGNRVDFYEAEKLARAEQGQFEACDPWEEQIRAFTDCPPCVQFQDLDEDGHTAPRVPMTELTIRFVISHILHLNAAQSTKQSEQRIAPILRRLGWSKGQRKEKGHRIAIWTRMLP